MKLKLISAAAILLVSGAAMAQESGFGPYAGIGTLGVSVGVKHQYNENLSVRAGLNTFSYDVDLDEGDVRYEGELDMKSAELIADWHPFGGGFYLSAGLLYNDNQMSGTAHAQNGSITINDVAYNGVNAQANFSGKLDSNKISPYVGVGYVIKPAAFKGVQLYANLGVIHQDIETSLSVSGIEDPTGTLADNVREANRRLQDDADKLELYPVANIGVAYRF